MPWEPLPGAVAQPRRLGSGLDHVLKRLGAAPASTISTIVEQWHEIVGAELAAVTTPSRIDKGCLTVSTEDSAYTTEVRYAEPMIRRRIVELTGDDSVTRVRVMVGRRPRSA